MRGTPAVSVQKRGPGLGVCAPGSYAGASPPRGQSRGRGLRDRVRPGEQDLRDGDGMSVLTKEPPGSPWSRPSREDTARRRSMSQEAVVTRHGICWHLGPGRPAPGAVSCHIGSSSLQCAGFCGSSPPMTRTGCRRCQRPSELPGLWVAPPSHTAAIFPGLGLFVPHPQAGHHGRRSTPFSEDASPSPWPPPAFPGTEGEAGARSPSSSRVAGPLRLAVEPASPAGQGGILRFGDRRGPHLRVRQRGPTRRQRRPRDERKDHLSSVQRPPSGATLPLRVSRTAVLGAVLGNKTSRRSEREGRVGLTFCDPRGAKLTIGRELLKDARLPLS